MKRIVGIKELKTNLSKYIREVKEGKEVLVSERGKEVAQIMPVYLEEGKDKVKSLLLRLHMEGKIIMPRVFKKTSRPIRRKKVKGSPFSDAVIEGRR